VKKGMTDSKLFQALHEKCGKADDLRDRVTDHCKKHDVTDEVDFYQVKNTALCSYLLDITCLIQVAVAKESEKPKANSIIQRLDHLRVLMDKMRILDKKLAYQLEKQLALANSDLTSVLSNIQPRPNLLYSQPSSKKSNPVAKENDMPTSLDDDDEDLDEELQAAKHLVSTAKTQKDDLFLDNDVVEDAKGSANIYRPPQLSSVEYHEAESKNHQALAKQRKRERDRLLRSEALQALQEQYGSVPEQDGVGTIDQGTSHHRLLERQARKEKFEEKYMVRLTESRKDKKLHNRLRTQEQHGNLSSMYDLSNLTSGIDIGDADAPHYPKKRQKSRKRQN